MNKDIYESGECTDDGLSDSSVHNVLQNNIKKKKKKRKEKKIVLEIAQYYKSIKQQYFNPYIYQRTRGTKNFSRTKSLLTDFLNGVGMKKKFEERKKFLDEEKFSIKKLDLKKYEYLSYIKLYRNECYSPDPYNPIKINVKTNIKTFIGNTKSLENYFEIADETKIITKPEKIIDKLCDNIDSSSSWKDLLLNIGISNGAVKDLMDIVLIKNIPESPRQNVELQKFHMIGNYKELSEDDMDISEDELENIPIVIDNVSNSDKDLSELINSNSLYIRDYSPEHISYHDFVTNFGGRKSTNQIFYGESFKY